MDVNNLLIQNAYLMLFIIVYLNEVLEGYSRDEINAELVISYNTLYFS